MTEESAGIVEQSMRLEPSWNRVVVPACLATKNGGIDFFFVLIPGLLNSLKIQPRAYLMWFMGWVQKC